MQIVTHEEFAKRLTTNLRSRLKSDGFCTGALAPNRSQRLPQKHHQNRRARDILVKFARTARKEFIAGRYASAAFDLGVLSHYALDNLVPHEPPSRDHTRCEARFAEVDRDIDYPEQVQAALGDGRAAERAIREMIWVAGVTPLNFEQRLTVVHACLLRLGYAVTEDPEPLDIIQELADTFITLTSGLEGRLQQYREHLKAAAKLQLRAGVPRLGSLGGLGRSAVARCAAARAEDRAPGALDEFLERLCLRSFRRAMQRALEHRLGPEENARQLDMQARQEANRYRQMVQAVRTRRMHWNWFNVQWDFWLEKGALTVKFVRSEVQKAQESVMRPAVQAFRAACAGEPASQTH